MAKRSGIYYVLVVYTHICSSLGEQQFGEEAIIKNLFLTDPATAEARRILRPFNSAEAVKVNFKFSPTAITDVDEKNGFISIQMSEMATWQDPRLKWEPSDYSKVDVIKIPIQYIWQPDVLLFTSGSTKLNRDIGEERAIVTSTGDVLYVPIRNYNFRCNFNVTNFPYDSQKCILVLGSWLHTKDELEVVDTDTSTHALANNHSDWILQNLNVSSYSMVYDCCNVTFQTIQIELGISRRPRFYFSIFIAPAMATFFILPIIHLFPPGCSQKTTLAGLLLVCSLLLHVVLYQQLSGFSHENVPKLMQHYQTQLVMIIMSTGISTLTTSLANAVHTSRRVPAVMRKLTHAVLGRICWLRSPDVRGPFTHLGQSSEGFDPRNEMSQITNGAAADAHNQSDESAQLILAAEVGYTQERRQLEMEWYQIALLVDRLTFIIFIIYILAANAVIDFHD